MPTPAPAPTVSVIIPVYNAELYLEETVGSVLSQDIGLENIEILAVNDGSTDNSLSILRHYESVYPQFRVFTMQNSGSAAAPCNLGLDNARGTFVFILGSDDILEATFLSTAVNVAESTGDNIVLPKMEVFGVEGRGVPTVMFKQSHRNADFIDSKAYRSGSAIKLYRRNLLEKYKIRFPLGFAVGEDQPFALRAYLNSPTVSTLADKTYYWVRNRDDGSNLTANLQPAQAEMLKVKACIDEIMRSGITGTRRELLFSRYLLGSNALRGCFGSRFTEHLSAEERKVAVDEFRDLLKPVYTESLKKLAAPESQAILDFVVDGNLKALEHLSKEMAVGQLTFSGGYGG